MVDKINIKTQLISTLLTFFFTFLLPLLSIAQFSPIFEQTEVLLYLRPIIILNSILAIVLGGVLTVLRYIVFYFEKRSLKRGIINLISTLLVLFLLVSSAQLSVVQINFEGSYIFLDIGGIFILLTVSWFFVVLKAVYDIIETKFYPNSSIKLTAREKIRNRTLLKCPKCKYMCRKEWKKCPICKSVLF